VLVLWKEKEGVELAYRWRMTRSAGGQGCEKSKNNQNSHDLPTPKNKSTPTLASSTSL
jgi:hypothetical protein